VRADDPPDAAATATAAPARPTATPRPPGADPQAAVTHHSVTVNGQPIAYTVHAGTMPLRNAEGDEIARVFIVAYTVDGGNPRTRPVTFLWNGGPGTATMWLQMGSYGPVRVAVPSDATLPAPNVPVVPNPDTLLDVSDLVFIDAVGTGYSRITGKGTPKTFYGVDEDARAFDDIIRAWTTANDRWSSPKFLFGESYGTMRAATTVARLQNDGMAINGVVLLSSALDYNALDTGQGPGEDYSYIAFLPSLAAVAWYHKALPANVDLDALVRDVDAFAIGPYADALMRGDTLDPATRRTVIAKLHAYTGLDAGYIDRANLRIDPSRFEHELLAPRGLVTGRVDARYQGPELDRTGDSPAYDPSFSDAMTDAYVGAFTRYVRDDLGYKIDRPYIGGSGAVNRQWNYRRTRSIVAPNGAGDLRAALTKNPSLRVFSANGYFDLATPFFGTEYTLNHLALDPSVRSHVEFGYYTSGHMVYHNDDARRALKADLVRFYREAEGR
jgi:carboxypeptidase C (cathepsin A)